MQTSKSLLTCASLVALLAAGPAWAHSHAEFEKQVAAVRASMLGEPREALKLAQAAAATAATEPTGSERELALATARWLRGEAMIRQNQAREAKPNNDQAQADAASLA